VALLVGFFMQFRPDMNVRVQCERPYGAKEGALASFRFEPDGEPSGVQKQPTIFATPEMT
jgi:hypothetical protein